jgi:hypothetical protein
VAKIRIAGEVFSGYNKPRRDSDGGKKFAVTGNSAYVTLSFKMKKLSRFEKDQRVVKGMKL